MNKRLFWIIVIAMHLLSMIKQLFFGTTFLQDSKEYLFAAENLINHHTLYAWDLSKDYNPNWLTKRPFLYPAILAFFKQLSFGNSGLFLFLLLLVQNIISLFSIRLAKTMAIRLSGQINYKIAILLILFTPAQAIYANLIMSEIWLQCLLVLLLNCLLFKPNSLGKTALLALLCIGAMSLKPVMLLTAFCLPVYCFLVYPLKSVYKPLAIGLLPFVFLFSVSKFNEGRTGYFQYSSISTINLFQYNTYTLLINNYGVTMADSIVDDIQLKANQQAGYQQKQMYIEKACRQIIGEDIVKYGYLHARGAILCLIDPGRFDLTQFFNLTHRNNLLYEVNKQNNFQKILHLFLNPLGILLLLILLVNLYKLFWAIRFLFVKNIAVRDKLILLFIPLYILLLTGPIGSSRFALPFFPIYFVIILIAFNRIKATKQSK